MGKIQQARYAYLTLFVAAMLCTPVLAQHTGTATPGAMETDQQHNAGQTHGMNKMNHKPMQMEMANEGIFEGTGEIIALVPDKGQVVVKHEEIVGFMPAMTMGYPVQPTSLLDGLKAGDVVKFKIDAAKEKNHRD